MKCINKWKRLLCTISVAAVFLTGCSVSNTIDSNYNVSNSALIQAGKMNPESNTDFFSKDICVAGKDNIINDQVRYNEVASGAGVFNLDTKEVKYSQNIYDKLYPASTTKVLTAYIILKYGNLDDMVTVSAEAAGQPSDSSIAHLRAGDVISVRELLYGLMIVSGNDAAQALAEYYSGSVEAFAEVMNQEAAKIGATNSHFVNPHGLPDEMHYTTVYDMYLMFAEAVKDPTFVEIISTKSHEAVYSDANGNQKTQTWNNTNGFLTGKYKMPERVQVLGGKTGTTFEAGFCLVALSTNEAGQRIVSVVMKADCKANLYLLTSELLKCCAN